MESAIPSPFAAPREVRAAPLAIARWLLIVAAMVAMIVVVGGITRLTESGVSITEWKPVTGALPPLTDAQWQAEFDAYRQTPQYLLVNGPAGMTLADYKFIFFWEWVHRLLARTIGMVFALPLAWFWVKGRIPAGYKPRLLALLALGGLQGAVGWWMVKSGIVHDVKVSHFRLAAHLLVALVTLAGLVWTALDLRALARGRARSRLTGFSALVLAMLVLFVLIVVIFQVSFSSHMELEQAVYHVDRVRFRLAADACRLQAHSVLLMDIEDAGEDAGVGGALGGSGTDVTSQTDSLLDEWMSPAALEPSLGEGMTLFVEVVDEDSKVNLLGLWAEDDEKRAEWRECFSRLLDRCFEGTSLDLSGLDAEDVVDALDEWVTGSRSFQTDVPVPPLKKSMAMQEAEGSLDTDIIENDEIEFPLTLGELLVFEDLRPEHILGFVEDGVFYPGLDHYLTVWSHVELQEPEEDETDPFADSPLDDEPEEGEDDEDGDGGGGSSSDGTSGAFTNDGLVNANTAPLAVLRALAPDDIPTSFLERVVEYREKIYEVRDQFHEDRERERQDSLFAGDSVFDDTEGEDQLEGDEDDDDDPAQFVFERPDDVFDKVEAEFELSIFTDEEEKQAFVSRLGVTSQVFTIKILVWDEKTDHRATYRTVVWRSEAGEEGPEMVTLLPLEEYHDTRRLEDYPEEVAELAEQRSLGL